MNQFSRELILDNLNSNNIQSNGLVSNNLIAAVNLTIPVKSILDPVTQKGSIIFDTVHPTSIYISDGLAWNEIGSTAPVFTDIQPVLIGLGATATGGNTAIAIGCDSTSSATRGLALGENSVCSGVYSVSIGSNSQAIGAGSVAIGGSVDIGSATKASVDSSISIGGSNSSFPGAVCSSKYTVVIGSSGSGAKGPEATSDSISSIVIGSANSNNQGAESANARNICIGSASEFGRGAYADSQSSGCVILGTAGHATVASSSCFGPSSVNSKNTIIVGSAPYITTAGSMGVRGPFAENSDGAIIFGSAGDSADPNSKSPYASDASNSIVIGSGHLTFTAAKSQNPYAIVIGSASTSYPGARSLNCINAISIGTGSSDYPTLPPNNVGSIAIGTNTRATGTSIAIGTNAFTQGIYNIAIGHDTQTDFGIEHSISIGSSVTATESYSMNIGAKGVKFISLDIDNTNPLNLVPYIINEVDLATNFNHPSGVINMTNSLSSNTADVLTILNTKVKSTSIIHVTCNATTANNYPCCVNVSNIIDGVSFNINIFNPDPTDPTTDHPSIYFTILYSN